MHRTKKVVSRPPYIAPLEEQKCYRLQFAGFKRHVVSSSSRRSKAYLIAINVVRIVYCER